MNETNQMTASAPVKFYVGDLCYVLNRDQWDTVCCHDFLPDSDGDYDPQGFLRPEDYTYEDEEAGHPFYIFRTFYGDGCYSDQEGRQYCVDSGTIGCIRVEYADPEKLADAVERGLGHLYEFDEEFCGYGYCGEEDGTIWFTAYKEVIEIDTGGASWGEEEEAD